MIINRLILLTIVISTLGCLRSNKDEKNMQQNDTLLDATEQKTFQSVYYRFPTPNEVFTFVKSENLAFDATLTNLLKNVDKYLDSKSQTIALGIYIADLAYLTLFESYNNSVAYYKAIHKLSEKIRITSAYDLAVAKRIEKNLLNLDSLRNISVDSYSSMVEFLIMNNRETTLALIATGAYIECFYIAFNLAGNYSSNNPLIAKIIDLKYAFENLYAYLQIYSDNQHVKETSDQLTYLNDLFKQIKENKTTKTSVRQDKDGKLIFEGGTTLEINKEIFNAIKDEIFKLRKAFI